MGQSLEVHGLPFHRKVNWSWDSCPNGRLKKEDTDPSRRGWVLMDAMLFVFLQTMLGGMRRWGKFMVFPIICCPSPGPVRFLYRSNWTTEWALSRSDSPTVCNSLMVVSSLCVPICRQRFFA